MSDKIPSGKPVASRPPAEDEPSKVSVDAEQQAKLLKLQLSMQRENQVFTAVSNVLKTRHDTTKNSIENIK